MAKNLQFNSQQILNMPFVEKGHHRQCYYQKFEETALNTAYNRITLRKVYVHIRICQCHFDRDKFPDRSRFIHNNHPKDGTQEQDGIEFHLSNDCEWIWLGDGDDGSLKRVCVCRNTRVEVLRFLVVRRCESYAVLCWVF